MDNGQIRLGDMEKLRHRVSNALLALWVRTETDTPPGLGNYSAWESVRAVPDDALPQLVRDLEGEVRCRRALGDEKYYATRTAAGKRGLYLAALDMTKAILTRQGRVLVGGTWAEYRRALSSAMADAAWPPKKPPRRMRAAPARPAKEKARPAVKHAPPGEAEIGAYMREYADRKGLNLSLYAAEKFLNHYTANTWKVGRGVDMVDWQAAARNWVLRDGDFARTDKGNAVRAHGRAVGPGEDVIAAAAEYVPLKTNVCT